MNNNKKIKPVVIVFDLDETLGYFTQLGCFYDILEKYNNRTLTQAEFFEILDMNQEYLRPKILDLLQYILELKKNKKIDSVMIYTNNQGPKRWSNSIANYFSFKLNEPVFDNIIHAFKIKGQIVEPNRTTHEKSYNDFLRCTKMPDDTLVYFIDDIEHPKMIHDNVYYVNVKPYHFSLPLSEVLSRYCKKKNLSQEESQKIWNKIVQTIPKEFIYPKEKDIEEQNVDVLTGKLLITQMSEFFEKYFNSSSLNKSLKKYSNKFYKNKTLKRYRI